MKNQNKGELEKVIEGSLSIAKEVKLALPQVNTKHIFEVIKILSKQDDAIHELHNIGYSNLKQVLCIVSDKNIHMLAKTVAKRVCEGNKIKVESILNDLSTLSFHLTQKIGQIYRYTISQDTIQRQQTISPDRPLTPKEDITKDYIAFFESDQPFFQDDTWKDFNGTHEYKAIETQHILKKRKIIHTLVKIQTRLATKPNDSSLYKEARLYPGFHDYENSDLYTRVGSMKETVDGIFSFDYEKIKGYSPEKLHDIILGGIIFLHQIESHKQEKITEPLQYTMSFIFNMLIANVNYMRYYHFLDGKKYPKHIEPIFDIEDQEVYAYYRLINHHFKNCKPDLISQTWSIESILDYIRNNQVEIRANIINVMLNEYNEFIDKNKGVTRALDHHFYKFKNVIDDSLPQSKQLTVSSHGEVNKLKEKIPQEIIGNIFYMFLLNFLKDICVNHDIGEIKVIGTKTFNLG